MMTLVRSIQTMAAGVWLGGMVLIAIVAATTFGEMRKTGVERPNAIAGRVMAVNFQRFDKVQSACAGMLIVGQCIVMAMGRRGGREWFHAGLIVACTGLLAYSMSVISPQILEMQSAVGSPDADAAVKAIFDKIHGTSVRVSQINLFVIAVLAISLGAGRISKIAAKTVGAAD